MADDLVLESLQVGDLLRISCPMAPARVAGIGRDYAYVEWPWREIDPASRFRWNGQRAFARDPDSHEWIGPAFRTDPEPWHLTPNAMCRVGIPETIVQITSVHQCEPPEDRGWLPRPRIMLGFIPADHPEYIDIEDAGDTLYFPSAEPITIGRAASPVQG